MDRFSTTPQKQISDWRKFFTDRIIEKGSELLRKGLLHTFSCSEDTAKGEIITPNKAYYVCISNAPVKYGDDWDTDGFICTCGSKITRSKISNGKKLPFEICPHMSAILLHWEKSHGVWVFTETEEMVAERIRIAHEEEAELEKLKRIDLERKRLQKEKDKLSHIKVNAAEFFPGAESGGTFFDVKKAVAGIKTNKYAVKRAKSILETGKADIGTPGLEFGRTGEQILNVFGSVADDIEKENCRILLGRKSIEYHSCSCRYGFWYSVHSDLCEHELAALTELREYIQENDPGDATDLAGDNFFHALEEVSAADREEKSASDRGTKEKRIVISPQISINSEKVQYSFKVGLVGGKHVQLKSFRDFIEAAENEESFALTKKQIIDFSEYDFTDESFPWLTFIQRRVSETDNVNERLARRRSYTASISVGIRDSLSGAALDRFYEIADGSQCEYHDNANNIRTVIKVGHSKMRVVMSTDRIADNNGVLVGVSVSGNMPVILEGSAGSYILSSTSLSKITKEEAMALRPFKAASDTTGNIRFSIGRDKLAEFYYRVLPKLTESSYVEITDSCAEEAAELLPPEPVFTFKLDIDSVNNTVTCDVLVAYNDTRRRLNDAGDRNSYHDELQERRAANAVQKYFSRYLPQNGFYVTNASDDALFLILTDGIAELSEYGEVIGSDAFYRSSVSPMPQLNVSVSMDSGLLELSILSKDISAEELLSVLKSYRMKKKYHRLNSGDYISIDENEQLLSIERLMSEMELDAEDVIGKKLSLPAYRAIYLNSLLEDHESLVLSRNRRYRQLIKNFRTIRDADYETPSMLEDILRPYQVYGYKWLRTLSDAGFGSILADEMGLGKTVQTIALMQSLRDADDNGVFLIVCPASLIYNWQEEFSRFSPGLDVSVMAGTPAVRKKKLKEIKKERCTVCITSYDLLRQDIAAYKDIDFSLMVIDEAQYIKNQKAAMTKAVKAVNAAKRIALTGTPIENRLAELWSIFDFIMPGFLYGYAEFSRRFETPIAKQKDNAAISRLKQMTNPFILRRLKTNVLKELPPKLEEVHYTKFETEQRKLYDGQVVHMKQLLANSGEGDKIKILAELIRIRQICCDPSLIFEDYSGRSAKREACLELIRNAISGGHRILLFSQFTSMLALLENELKNEDIPYYKITGSTSKEARARLVRDFNEGDTPVFLISLKAGGTGLNLTGADTVIHYDPWWNVAAQNQATDRAHRIGQKNKVTVYRMIVKGTIEEKILALQESKRDLADKILSGESTSLTSLTNEELLALFE